MKQYRIGDYAKYLGVTPDLLKHYEEMGIIHSERSESGYRYYSFYTTVGLIESIRLRNYGLTLREIRDILSLHSTQNEEMERLLENKLDLLRQEVQLDEALVQDYTDFCRWKEPLEARDWDWEIRWARPMCFLPHTDRYDFLQDSRFYDLLSSWMSYIPIVKSALKAGPNGHIAWGFLVEEDILQQLGLPVNDIVERQPARRIFYYKFRAPLLRLPEESADNPEHPAFSMLRDLRLTPEDTYFRTTLMPADWSQKLRYQYGYYAIPLRDTGTGGR